MQTHAVNGHFQHKPKLASYPCDSQLIKLCKLSWFFLEFLCNILLLQVAALHAVCFMFYCSCNESSSKWMTLSEFCWQLMEPTWSMPLKMQWISQMMIDWKRCSVVLLRRSGRHAPSRTLHCFLHWCAWQSAVRHCFTATLLLRYCIVNIVNYCY